MDGVAKWEGVRIAGTPREVARVHSLAFFDCELDGVSLAGERLSLRLVDCTAVVLDLANAQLDGLEVTCSSLRESRLVGAALGGLFRDVVVSDCLLDLASLRMAKLARCELHACSLTEADLYAAELESVLFEGCDLTGAHLSQATFELCELRRCELQGVRGIEALRGAPDSAGRPPADHALAGRCARHRSRRLIGRPGRSPHGDPQVRSRH